MKSNQWLFIITTLLTSLLSIQTFGQTTLNGAIRDGSGKPLPFASVALLNSRDSSVAKGTASDQQGTYAFENVRAGQYIVRATTVGFQKIYSIRLDVLTSPTNAPTLTLSELTGKLAEVTVQRPTGRLPP